MLVDGIYDAILAYDVEQHGYKFALWRDHYDQVTFVQLEDRLHD